MTQQGAPPDSGQGSLLDVVMEIGGSLKAAESEAAETRQTVGTPAVRSVQAWDGGRGPTLTIEEAYEHAAHVRTQGDTPSAGRLWSRFAATNKQGRTDEAIEYVQRVRNRLSRFLRWQDRKRHIATLTREAMGRSHDDDPAYEVARLRAVIDRAIARIQESDPLTAMFLSIDAAGLRVQRKGKS